MVLFGVVFLVLQFALGSVISNFIDPEKRLNKAELFFISVVVGTATSSFILLLFLLISKSWHFATLLLWILLIVTGSYAFRKNFREIKFQSLLTPYSGSLFTPVFWFFLITLFVYSAILIGTLILNEKGLFVGILKGWGDVAYHLDMIGRLKVADPFVLEHPVLAGERLTYPFIVNLLSALYERVGFPKLVAFHLPVFVFGFSFLFLVYLLGNRLFRNVRFSMVLVLLVFFGGGIGFIWFFNDLWIAWNDGGINTLLSTFFNPPHEYTHLDTRTGGKPYETSHNIVWIVPIVSFLSHQRSYVLGASAVVVIILGFISYKGNSNLWRWATVWGMIPLLHSHSFLAVTIILLCFFFYDIKNWTIWFKGAILGGVIALPQVLYLIPSDISGSADSSFFKLWFGWMTCPHNEHWFYCDPDVEGVDSNPLWFWSKNFGIVFWSWIISVFAFFIIYRREKFYVVKPFILPSLLLFILPNIILFQPWEFDNNKILYYWWILASIIALYFFQVLYQKYRKMNYIFVAFVMISVSSGMIDVYSRISNFNKNHYRYYGINELLTADWIKDNTDPNSVFLTDTKPTQFIPMLTGRPIYLGYHGWLWTQGRGDIMRERTKKVEDYMSTGNFKEICNDDIKYILWDESLLETYTDANYEKILSSSEVIYTQELNGEPRKILRVECTN